MVAAIEALAPLLRTASAAVTYKYQTVTEFKPSTRAPSKCSERASPANSGSPTLSERFFPHFSPLSLHLICLEAYECSGRAGNAISQIDPHFQDESWRGATLRRAGSQALSSRQRCPFRPAFMHHSTSESIKIARNRPQRVLSTPSTCHQGRSPRGSHVEPRLLHFHS